MSSIPLEIAKASLNDLNLRAQLRLFYWFKTHMPDKFYLTDEVKKDLLMSFSRYELKRHFQALLDKKFISMDKTGLIFLRGRKYYQINFPLKNKKFRSCAIPEKALESRNGWIGFIDGCCIDSRLRSAKQAVSKRERKRVTASSKWGASSSDGIPLSLELLMPLGRSKGGASKMRKRAAAGGWITNEQQLQLLTSNENPKGVKIDRQQYLEYRGLIAEREGAAYANKIIWKRGYLFLQLPNLVSSKMNSRCQRF